VSVAGCGGGSHGARTTTSHAATAHATTGATRATGGATATTSASTAPQLPTPRRPPFAVAQRTVTLIDRSRTIRYSDGSVRPRILVTILRYPLRAWCPCPLVVFGHGFAVTPAPYAALLRAWARAGYVVAAPVFPLENAHAPGGPNESDLVNQPRDMSVVITQLSRRLPRLVDRQRIAVSGQSDGGETALAVAYDIHFRDRRVRAAMILSGAKIPGVGGFTFPATSAPLLATQGTSDTINPPSFTAAFFDIAPRPKYLLALLGAGHLPPYTVQQPQLRIVEAVTIAFLDRYVRGERAASGAIGRAGDVPGVARVESLP
jgi:predicted dienelactone hydrolase